MSAKIRHLCDGHGLPQVVLIGPGHTHDSPMFEALMDQLRMPQAGRGRPRTRPQAVLGDRAYSSRATRAHLRLRGICAVIPNSPPRPITADAGPAEANARSGSTFKKYKGRNVIERFFNTIRNWRGLATRYDELALTYRAAALLAAICAWLRHLRDTPWST